MEKKEKREAKGHKANEAGQRRVVRGPITAEERAQIMKDKPKWSCRDCIFCVASLGLWARTLLSGFPMLGMCANHPDTPGQLRPVRGRPCRNFQAMSRLDRAEPVPPNPKVRYIRLTKGLHAIVDADDFEWLDGFKWCAATPKSGRTSYAHRRGPGGTIFMHRLIMNPTKGMVVDHINGNGLDNRRCNLRICTLAQNLRNRRKFDRGRSRFIGVYPCGNKWAAKVAKHYVGLFDDEVEAAQARDRKAVELYGEHAWLNFPPENPPQEGQ